MSGGHFDYNQRIIDEICEDIDNLIKVNNEKDEYGYCNGFSDESINEFKRAIEILKQASVYTQRIDWLVSGDDGEETFHERLKDELNKI